MGNSTHFILVLADDTVRYRELCAELEHDSQYLIQQGDLQAAAPAPLPGGRSWELILILASSPHLLLRNRASQLAAQWGIPVIFLSREHLPAADASRQSSVQHLYDDGAASVQALALKLGIKIRIAVTRAITGGRAGKSPAPRDSLSASAEPSRLKQRKLIAIGASMGGVEAVNRVLEVLPPEMPGIVVVQHMPKGFTDLYAKRLDASCRLTVVQARDRQSVDEGTVYIAPGDFHMRVEKNREGGYLIRIADGERVSGHRPSADVLFRSVAGAAGKAALGIILTGMGEDGARGLLEMRRAGAETIGQNAETSVVYGMPKVAYELGAVSRQLPLEEIPRRMVEYASRG